MRLTFSFVFSALLLASFHLDAATDASLSPTISDLSYTKPARLVDVGSGRMMNIRCQGTGSPTVILDAGLGDDTISWAMVQPGIALTTQVCSYDRAGLGFSDGNQIPSTAKNNAQDLHSLLGAANIGPPYVLVAHSAAGMYIRVFADHYPSEVAGMVSVEGSHEDQSRKGWAIGAPGQKEKWDAFLTETGECVGKAQVGLAKGTPDFEKCVGQPDPMFSQEINDVRARVAATPHWQSAVNSERRALFYASAEETRTTRKSYGAIPIIVLTHSPYPKRDDETQEERDRRTLLWEFLHLEIAAMSTRGINIIVPNSGHYV